MARKDPIIKRTAGDPYSKRNNNLYKIPSKMEQRIYIPYKKYYKSFFRNVRKSNVSIPFDSDVFLGFLILIIIAMLIAFLIS